MLPLVIALAALAGGTACASLFDPEVPFVERLIMGAAIGLALLGLVGFVLASFWGLSAFVVTVAAALVATVPSVFVARRRTVSSEAPAAARARRTVRPFTFSVPLAAYFAVVAIFLAFFFAHAAYEKDGAIVTDEWNNLGDLGLHLAIANGFVKGENFPPEHPDFAGARLTYPFLCDFIAAELVAAGMPLLQAFYFQNLLTGIVLVALLYRWTFVLTRDGLAAFLVPVVVLFCGGVGFLTFVREAQEQGVSFLGLLHKPPHAVTILWGAYDEIFRWGNALTAFFLPQRAWLVGLPLALLVWTLWWQAVRADDRRTRERRLVAAGFIAGLLPLAHAHSFMVLMGMAACLTVLYRRYWKSFALFHAAALLLAAPQIVWVTRNAGASAGSFLAWHHGWAKPEGVALSLVSFWLLNTGLTIPLAIAALVWRGQPRLVSRELLFFLSPFLLCLVLPNVIKLSPWEWDTNKVLFYGYLALVIPIALLVARLLRGRVWAKAAGAAALVLLTLSGAIDVWRVLSGVNPQTQFDADTVAQARLIEERTPPRARILSAWSASRAVLLTGRRSLVGHPWTVWSHGLSADARIEAARKIFAGAPEAAALLAEHAIDFVLVGPQERADPGVNDAYFATLEKVGEAGGASLYRVRPVS